MLGQMHQDADYNYDQSGVGYHVGNRPHIKWDHPDGALLYFRNGEITGSPRGKVSGAG